MSTAAPRIVRSDEIECPTCRASWCALLDTPARGSFRRCEKCRAADAQLSFLEWGYHREQLPPKSPVLVTHRFRNAELIEVEAA